MSIMVKIKTERQKGQEGIMTKSEINEIKKQFAIDACTIERICGCYVNDEKEKMCVSREAFLSLPEEEEHKYFDILKKTLSGTEGKNLLELEFPLAEEANGGKQDFLYRLRNSELKDDGLVDEFFDRIIETYDTVERYFIILVFASYDVPGKATDNLMMDDASENVFNYMICSICPVKRSKAVLSYNARENRIGERIPDWVVSDPEKGFMFPAFEDGGADVHKLIYYSKKSEELMENFIDNMFGAVPPVSAGYQAEVFNSIINETLGEDCLLETVKNINENVGIILRDHENSDPEPVVLQKEDVKKIFFDSGVDNETMEYFDDRYDRAVAKVMESEDTDNLPPVPILAKNLPGVKKFDIRTPDIVIRVNPERTDLIRTQVIDGRQCLVITVDDRVQVNGLSCRTIGKK